METFAAKVKFGNGSRFNPLLEERGGWIAGEAQKHDTEMADAVIEMMAEASQPSVGDLNPFKGHAGVVLPPNLERNFSGFLMRKDAIVFKVNPDKLAAPRGVHYENIRTQRAGKYRVIYIHKRKNLEFS